MPHHTQPFQQQDSNDPKDDDGNDKPPSGGGNKPPGKLFNEVVRKDADDFRKRDNDDVDRKVDEAAAILALALKKKRAAALAAVLEVLRDENASDERPSAATIAKARSTARNTDPDAYADRVHKDALVLAELAWIVAAAKLGVDAGFDAAPAWAQKELRAHADEIGKTISENDKRTMLAEIDKAIAEGKSAKDTITALKSALAPITSYKDDGSVSRVLDGESYLGMVAVTELHRASVIGATALYEKAGVTKVRWEAMPDACDLCAEADGVVRDIGEAFPGVDVDAPPSHPNCRCAVEPITGEA